MINNKKLFEIEQKVCHVKGRSDLSENEKHFAEHFPVVFLLAIDEIKEKSSAINNFLFFMNFAPSSRLNNKSSLQKDLSDRNRRK